MIVPKDRFFILENKEVELINYYISFLQNRIASLEHHYSVPKCCFNIKPYHDHFKIDKDTMDQLIETFNLLPEFKYDQNFEELNYEKKYLINNRFHGKAVLIQTYRLGIEFLFFDNELILDGDPLIKPFDLLRVCESNGIRSTDIKKYYLSKAEEDLNFPEDGSSPEFLSDWKSLETEVNP